MAALIERAAQIVLGDAPVERVLPTVSCSSCGFPELLSPLTVCLDRASVVGRHALRFGLVCAAGVVVFWFFPPPFGYPIDDALCRSGPWTGRRGIV